MRPAVLYTHDLEPITVIDVPEWAWPRLRQGEPIRLLVPVKLDWREIFEQGVQSVEACPMRTVTVTGELLRRRGAESLMLFTRDEEDALALKASFLAGQRGEVNRRERAAYYSGLFQWLGGD